MKEMIITVGISGTGKTTYAGLLPHTELNRDDYRLIVGNVKKMKQYQFTTRNEARVLHAIETEFLRVVENGEDVIISDTNLSRAQRRRWIRSGLAAGYAVKVVIFDHRIGDRFKQIKDRDEVRGDRSIGYKPLMAQATQFERTLVDIEKEIEMYRNDAFSVEYI